MIERLYNSFEELAFENEGLECWSARELCQALGYSQWRNFLNVIEKAKEACYLIAQNGDPRKEQIAFAQTFH